MSKSGFLAIVTAAMLLTSGSFTATHAASAHNSQAGGNGPSNVDGPIDGSSTARR